MTDHPQEALPPLPEPDGRITIVRSRTTDGRGTIVTVIDESVDAYTAEKLRAYAEAAVARERERSAELRNWAVLAFRALNNVGPALLHQECETYAERELVDRLVELAEAAASQYLAVAGVRREVAIADALDALAKGP